MGEGGAVLDLFGIVPYHIKKKYCNVFPIRERFYILHFMEKSE
jgi:hypothetical protein